MAHGRKLIRQAVAKILLGQPYADVDNPTYAISEVGKNVFPNRPTPLFEYEVPAILIYFGDETSDAARSAARDFHDRRPMLYVEVIVNAEDGFDDDLDDIAEKIENLLLRGKFIVDPETKEVVSKDTQLVETDIQIIGDEVGNVVASLRLGFALEYESESTYEEADGAVKFEEFNLQIGPADSNATIDSNTVGRLQTSEEPTPLEP